MSHTHICQTGTGSRPGANKKQNKTTNQPKKKSKRLERERVVKQLNISHSNFGHSGIITFKCNVACQRAMHVPFYTG